MWTEYFKMVKVHRGRIVTQSHGEIDFSADNIGIETCKELFDRGFPYLELTELGKQDLYGIEEKPPMPKQQSAAKRKKV